MPRFTTTITTTTTAGPLFYVTSTFLAMLIVVLPSVQFSVAHAYVDYCPPCNRTLHCDRPPPDCPHTLDSCGCCLVCAKMAGESCQGPYGQYGRCADDLVCMTQPKPGQPLSENDEGICQPTGQPPAPFDCDRAQCQVVFQPDCPPDSHSSVNSPAQGQCCPDPPTCQCLDCVHMDPVCPEGHLKVKVVDALGVPGQCCDIFDCQPRELVCADVVCPDEERMSNLTCPADSEEMPPMVTHNGCCTKRRCKCMQVYECSPVWCPEQQQVQVVHRATGLPGDCCDQWTCQNSTPIPCQYNGSEYEDGESWMLDSCTKTTCMGGIGFVEDLSLACETPADCSFMYKPAGKCCLECKAGCVAEDGRTYEDGAMWRLDDCLSCRCEGGHIHCMVEDCLYQNCNFPQKVPGQCCPVCPNNDTMVLPPYCPPMHACALLCPHGYTEDHLGCPTCQCRQPEVMPECELHCPLGFQLDDNGETLCACLPPDDECPRLSNCTKLNCIYGYRRDDRGCPKCRCRKCPQVHCGKKCRYGYEYNENGCKICRCRGSEVNTTMAPAIVPSPGHKPGGSGSIVCMSVDGHLMEEGQSWHDGCRRCFCYGGREMCALITCPVAPCRNPFIKMGDCCPSCGALEIYPLETTSCRAQDGSVLREGDTWSLDRCTLCICHDGGMLCDVETCPPTLCHQPYYKDATSCCPICPEEGTMIPAGMPIGGDDESHNEPCLSKSGFEHAHRDTWKVSPCTSCVCRDGQIHCFSQTCPILQCEKTTLVKGHCCPVCMEKSTAPARPHCVHAGEAYAEGERWLLDSCNICVCLDGQKMCTEEHCPSLPADHCPYTVTLPGTCCPVCSDTTLAPRVDDVTLEPGYRDDAAAGEQQRAHYQALIAVLVVIILLLITIVVLVVTVCLCCPHWRPPCFVAATRSYDPNNSKISHFTQTNGDLKKRPKSFSGDYKSSFKSDLRNSFKEAAFPCEKLSLQGITNTQMNEYTALPGVLNDSAVITNEYSTIPPLNDYATLNTGINMHVNEYTPLTTAESADSQADSGADSHMDSQTGSQTNSQTPIAWRYSSAAEDRTNAMFSDIPDLCDMSAGSRKSL